MKPMFWALEVVQRYCEAKCNIEIVRLLIAAGADVNVVWT
jgi:hypothetical protein